MRRLLLIILVALACVGPLAAEAPPAIAPGVPVGEGTKPVVLYGPDGKVVGFSPLPTIGMSFQRARDPFVLPATTTAQQYVVSQPEGTQSYLGINPCQGADIRVKTVAPIVTPIVSEPVTFQGQPVPDVRRVTSATETVSPTSGTLFMGRFALTLGSTPNPVSGSARVISIMLVPIPGSSVDISGMTCPFNLVYGNGN